jgi:hypothetical protein
MKCNASQDTEATPLLRSISELGCEIGTHNDGRSDVELSNTDDESDEKKRSSTHAKRKWSYTSQGLVLIGSMIITPKLLVSSEGDWAQYRSQKSAPSKR